MNKQILAVAVMALLTSCSGFKMGELTSDNFKVVPNPLEAEQGLVTATINGVFPEKFMNKKATVTVTPELRYTKDGQPAVKLDAPATFIGEKVLGNYQVIPFKEGGHYAMKSTFDYEPAMQQSELWMKVDAYYKDKKYELPAVKVADGVLATSELYHQTLTTATPCVATDSYQRVIAQKQEANIKFLIQQAELRKSELKSNSVQEFVNLLQRISADREGLNLQNVEVSAYASPDGGVALNEKLANKRQSNTEKYVEQQLKKANVEGAVEANYTAQDWEGFQQLVAASDIQDKDVILRVLSMYKDPQEREQQIKNLSHGFRELADGILPELRRARLTINYETVGRSDEQILSQLKADPSKLSIEEILYAATLTDNIDEKLMIYNAATAVYPDDKRAYNNIAALGYTQGVDAFQDGFTRAEVLPEAKANLGLIALKEGDIARAEQLIASASGAEGLSEVMGNLQLAKGNYVLAEQQFKDIKSNSAALAQIMNKNYAKAEQTLKAITNPDGMTYYLQAIVNARQGNQSAAASLLQKAIEKDSSLKQYAEKDLELVKLR